MHARDFAVWAHPTLDTIAALWQRTRNGRACTPSVTVFITAIRNVTATSFPALITRAQLRANVTEATTAAVEIEETRAAPHLAELATVAITWVRSILHTSTRPVVALPASVANIEAICAERACITHANA